MKNQPLINFCGHIGHILNTPVKDQRYVELSFFGLEKTMLQRLSRRRDYRTQIVGMPRMGGLSENNPEDCRVAATRWMERVLSRPMKARTGRQGAKPHELARMLSARAIDLDRRAAPRELPETLSVLGAFRQMPPRMRLLNEGEQDAFVHLLIQAVEAANVCWGRLIWIGLSPWDWPDVSVNQAKTLGKFYNVARRTDAAEWPKVWKENPVTKFKSFEGFMGGELGRATRQAIEGAPASGHGAHSTLSEEHHQIRDDEQNVDWNDPVVEKNVLDILEVLKNNGYITEFDAKIYLNIQKGDKFSEVFNRSWVREQFETFDQFKQHTDMLGERIIDAVEDINNDSLGNRR